jgi:hypothetical protein
METEPVPLPAPPAIEAPEPLSEGSEWTFELLDTYDREIRRVAAHYKLDTYPNQIEMITSEQMIDAYSSVGMPVGYHHWSYGKQFLSTQKSYKRGQMGLAYEIVINSSPCIAYLMEENTMTMQALVIAHAAYGHNSFFKGNYLFRTWTDAEGILDYLVFARNFIADCEQRHGEEAVEDLLDSCHALMNHGVDRYKRPAKLSMAKEQARQKNGRTTCNRRSTICGAPCRPRKPPKPASKERRFPARTAGKPALFHREERPQPGALAARDRAHRAQDCPVFLSAAADPGDERRLGHLLALHPAQPPLRGRQAHRRLHDGVPAKPHQRGLPAPLQQPHLQRHQPLRPGLRHVHGPAPHVRKPHRGRPPLVPGHRGHPTG